MALEKQIQEDLKAAMFAKDATALASIRGIKAAIMLEKTAAGASDELTDADIIKIIQKLVKQRKESAAIYTEQSRPELAEAELAEAAIMEKYLPVQLSEEEVEEAIKKIIAQVGAQSPADMGKVMGVATKALAGRWPSYFNNCKAAAFIASKRGPSWSAAGLPSSPPSRILCTNGTCPSRGRLYFSAIALQPSFPKM